MHCAVTSDSPFPMSADSTYKSLWVYSPPLKAHTFVVVVGVDTPQLAAGLFIRILLFKRLGPPL